MEKVNEAILAVCKGDAAGVSALYAEIAPAIRYIALKYVRNDTDADDLVQDFWADIYKIARGYSYIGNGCSYLFKVMTRRAITRYKELYRGKELAVSYVDYAALDYSAESFLERAELCAEVDRAMRLLTEEERIVIQEIYFEDKKLRAIARDMGISKMRVAQLRFSATEKLREAFGVSCGELLSEIVFNVGGQNDG